MEHENTLGQTKIELLKNALREKLARKRQAGEAKTEKTQTPAALHVGFGGRIIENEALSYGAEKWNNQAAEDQRQSAKEGNSGDNSQNDSINVLSNTSISHFGTKNDNTSHPTTLSNVPTNTSAAPNKAVPTHLAASGYTPQPVFILDDQKRTLMSETAMKAKLKRMRKAAEDKEMLKEQKKIQLKIKQKAQRLAKNKTKTDDCDRILLNGVIYAVDENGRLLVPLLDPDSETAEFIVWNQWWYARNRSGTLKRARKGKYSEQCRYFTRNGMFTRLSRFSRLSSFT